MGSRHEDSEGELDGLCRGRPGRPPEDHQGQLESLRGWAWDAYDQNWERNLAQLAQRLGAMVARAETASADAALVGLGNGSWERLLDSIVEHILLARCLCQCMFW